MPNAVRVDKRTERPLLSEVPPGQLFSWQGRIYSKVINGKINILPEDNLYAIDLGLGTLVQIEDSTIDPVISVKVEVLPPDFVQKLAES